jgi:hypothetical protein
LKEIDSCIAEEDVGAGREQGERIVQTEQIFTIAGSEDVVSWPVPGEVVSGAHIRDICSAVTAQSVQA